MKCRCDCIWSKDGECKSPVHQLVASDTSDGLHEYLVCESQVIVADDSMEVDLTA